MRKEGNASLVFALVMLSLWLLVIGMRQAERRAEMLANERRERIEGCIESVLPYAEGDALTAMADCGMWAEEDQGPGRFDE